MGAMSSTRAATSIGPRSGSSAHEPRDNRSEISTPRLHATIKSRKSSLSSGGPVSSPTSTFIWMMASSVSSSRPSVAAIPPTDG